MQSNNFQRRLEKLDSHQLINVVKNYRQYGYTLPMREAALALLSKQGIRSADFQLTGQFDNLKYAQAEAQYTACINAAHLVFGSYIRLLVLTILAFFGLLAPVARMALLGGIWLSTAFYLLVLVKLFLSQSAFYRAVGAAHAVDGALICLLLGLPFYIVRYFVFKR